MFHNITKIDYNHNCHRDRCLKKISNDNNSNNDDDNDDNNAHRNR